MNVFCLVRMAGVFDIDLETEDISDTEVCNSAVFIKLVSNTVHFILLCPFSSLVQDDVCDFTVTEPEK